MATELMVCIREIDVKTLFARTLILIGALLMPSLAAAQEAPRWTLVIHGGAGTMAREKMTPEKEAEIRAGLDSALSAGSVVLEQGGTAMDAVVAAIKVLEDDPNFNAGRGAVFTYDGINELDASIMDGRTRAAGAVAGAHYTKNPIDLARAVMEKSPHVMLSGAGADQFSKEQGLEQAPAEYFQTPERLRNLQDMKAKQALGAAYRDPNFKFGTVGAVALDQAGNVAAGTSTGGMTGKRWGRVGDSPIIGAGTYADNRACAVSGTGWGEYFIREGVAHEICARIRLTGEDPQTAANKVIAEMGAMGGNGGVIVTGPNGDAVWVFDTPGMYRGRATSTGTHDVRIFADEDGAK